MLLAPTLQTMLMQPYQNGRIALNAILELCLLVGEFTFSICSTRDNLNLSE